MKFSVGDRIVVNGNCWAYEGLGGTVEEVGASSVRVKTDMLRDDGFNVYMWFSIGSMDNADMIRLVAK